ncbi:MAG: PorP/SprF family type IX secretion system membrane protein [Bacteroidota bacterium]
MRLTLFISTILISIGSLKAQLDPLYAQYHFNQYMINPAYAGMYQNTSFAVNSRAQWFGLEGSPLTNTVTAMTNIGNSGGFGLRAMNDRVGIRSSNELVVSGSYFIRSHLTTIGFGLQGGVTQVSNDLNKLAPEVLDDPVLDDFIPQYSFPNFGFGVVIQRFDYFLGLSIPRILSEDSPDPVFQDNGRYQRTYYLAGGYRFTTVRSYDTKVQTLIRVLEDKISIDLSGTYFITPDIWAGTLIRDFSSLSFFGLLQIKDNYRIGYSFELPTNNLITTNFGTHEITFSYTITPFSGQVFEDRFF